MRFLVVIFLVKASILNAITVDVRLFSTATLSESLVTTHGADFYLIALSSQGNLIDTVSDFAMNSASKTLRVGLKSGKVKANQGNAMYGEFDGLLLVPKNQKSHFIIKGKGPERIYSGALIFKNSSNQLLVVNRVDLEDYVGGVVESEGGHETQFAYFKAQAVLARTWVLKNWNKHSKEGYNVRDDVSSQAYYSKAYLQNSESIKKAVLDTKDTILIDKYGDPIMGAFHSNSGGETTNSEDAWSAKIDYLRSVPDTFSLKMDKAYWEKEIDKQRFVNFFASKLGQNASNDNFRNAVLSYKQDTRQAYFVYADKKLKLRYVREKFGLRSTYFSVVDAGDKVVLKGRGFGHGVGLSQQGAMRMADLGFSYKQILTHYFKDVKYGVVSH